jgi:phage-related protein
MSEKRVPRKIESGKYDYNLHCFKDDEQDVINVDISTTFYNFHNGDVKELRKLSAWLSKAADYLDKKNREIR